MKGTFQMKYKTFCIALEGLSFGEKYKFDEQQQTQASIMETKKKNFK